MAYNIKLKKVVTIWNQFESSYRRHSYEKIFTNDNKVGYILRTGEDVKRVKDKWIIPFPQKIRN